MPVHPLPLPDLPVAAGRLRALAGSAARCVEFAVLSAARPKDALTLSRSRVDFVRGVWLSADEVARARYRPLSAEAIKLLQEQPNTVACDLFFPSPAGDPLSLAAFDEVVKHIAGHQAQPSSFRLTFGLWADRFYSGDVVLAALGVRPARDESSRHSAGLRNVEKARELFEEWARLCA